MMNSVEILPGKKRELTLQEIEMLEMAKKLPVVYDEDSPEMTAEMAERFRGAILQRRTRQAIAK